MKKTFKVFLNDSQRLTDDDMIIVETGIHDELKGILGEVDHDIDNVKRNFDSIVKKLGTKLKAWAIENMHAAKESGNHTSLLKRIINNPDAIAKQLINKKLNLEGAGA